MSHVELSMENARCGLAVCNLDADEAESLAVALLRHAYRLRQASGAPAVAEADTKATGSGFVRRGHDEVDAGVPASATADLPFWRATLLYLPPREPPEADAAWHASLDYPGVRLKLRVPQHVAVEQLIERLLSGGSLQAVLRGDAAVGVSDGDWYDSATALINTAGPGYRYLFRDFYAPTLVAAETAAELAAQRTAQRLSDVLRPRREREAMRQAHIAAAHAEHGRVRPPK